jgi:hypothetical protein
MTALAKYETSSYEVSNDISDEELAKLTGQSSGGTTDNLPRAYINRANDDEFGNIFPVGTFAIPIEGKLVFSKTCQFRVYYRGYQYVYFLPKKDDPEGKGKFVNSSVIIPNFSMEAPDSLGGTKCGKLSKKQKAQGMTTEQEKAQEFIKCVQYLYGTITFPKGGQLQTRNDSEDPPISGIEVNEVPCVFKLPQSSFMVITEAIDGFQKANKSMQRYKINMGLKRAQNGATTYYVIEPSVDFLNSSPYDPELLQTLLSHVKQQNDFVMAKHNKSLKGELTHEDVKDQHVFDPDLDDKLPF